MSSEYFEYCEQLWCDWLSESLDLSSFVRETFDMDAAPEPYLSFNAGSRPLVALTTNPGATMPHQRRAAVNTGVGPLGCVISYATAARRLGAFYEEELRGPPRHRITALTTLSGLLGCDGVLQVEACPFHSPRLPKKVALLDAVDVDPLLGRYVEQVRAFVQARSVIVLSAAPPQVSIGPETPLAPWVRWMTELADLVPARASFVPLVTKGSKVTCGAFVGGVQNTSKALVLMMGNNTLPSRKGIETLADALQDLG